MLLDPVNPLNVSTNLWLKLRSLCCLHKHKDMSIRLQSQVLIRFKI